MMDLNQGIDNLMVLIKNDYRANGQNMDGETLGRGAAAMVERFEANLSISRGSKYIKVIRDGSVWGFIVAGDGDAKFHKGDILKPASWAAPARNKARGNVISGNFRGCTWIGPAYLQ